MHTHHEVRKYKSVWGLPLIKHRVVYLVGERRPQDAPSEKSNCEKRSGEHGVLIDACTDDNVDLPAMSPVRIACDKAFYKAI